MAQTTKTAAMGCFQSRGDDFLHLIDKKGNDIGGIDPTGIGWGGLLQGGGMIPPPTKILFVDGNRTDSFVADGSLLKPFPTVTGAINQIIVNGDNAANVYVVYIAPKVYAETIILENLALVNIVFHGLGAAVISGGLRSQTNNSNLAQMDFRGLNFSGGNVTLTGGASFLSSGANFYDLSINVSMWTQTGNGSQFFDVSFSAAPVSLTNVLNFLFMGNRGPNTGTTFTLVNSPLTIQRGSRNGGTVSIDATSLLTVGPGGRQDGAVTVNGSFTNRGYVTGAITVNAGGTYTEAGGVHTGSLTLSGGSYIQTGTLGASAVMIGGIKVSAGSALPNGNVVGSPGDLYTSTTGGALQTLWVKETGVGTNSGWVAK